MQIFTFRDHDPAASDAILTVGNFDGVHLGHQALIRRVVDEARAEGGHSALMTFTPHPQKVLRNKEVPILTGLNLRLRLFEGLGLDAVYLVPFTRGLAAKSAEEFVAEYLIAHFRMRKLVIGYDFAFGRNRSGTAEVLSDLSGRYGFAFEIFPAVSLGEEIVSSTRTRAALRASDFALAEKLLGRPWSVLEPVVEGAHRGHELGFPTANLQPQDLLPIPFGVYVSRVRHEGRTYGGVSNYGLKPTVGSEGPTLETLLFDFEGDLYGELLEVMPCHRLRGEKKFPSLDALKAQIDADAHQARAWLGGQGAAG